MGRYIFVIFILIITILISGCVFVQEAEAETEFEKIGPLPTRVPTMINKRISTPEATLIVSYPDQIYPVRRGAYLWWDNYVNFTLIKGNTFTVTGIVKTFRKPDGTEYAEGGMRVIRSHNFVLSNGETYTDIQGHGSLLPGCKHFCGDMAMYDYWGHDEANNEVDIDTQIAMYDPRK